MKLHLIWLLTILLPILRVASSVDSKAQELSAEAEVELSLPLIAQEAQTSTVPPAYLPASKGALPTIQSRLPGASRCLHGTCHTMGFKTAFFITCLCGILALLILAAFPFLIVDAFLLLNGFLWSLTQPDNSI